MAVTFRNAVCYDGADLGFDAISIPGLTRQDGNVLPWSALGAIDSVALYVSVSVAVQVGVEVTCYTFDGRTAIFSNVQFWNPSSTVGAFMTTQSTGAVATNATPTAGIAVLLHSWPYIRISVNNLGAGAQTVTVRAALKMVSQSVSPVK